MAHANMHALIFPRPAKLCAFLYPQYPTPQEGTVNLHQGITKIKGLTDLYMH